MCNFDDQDSEWRLRRHDIIQIIYIITYFGVCLWNEVVSEIAVRMSEGDTTFDYTRPRVPIAASYTGPGPCYALPGLTGRQQHDPRSRHSRAPAYHFGTRPKQYADERNIGPGPCYLPPTTVNRSLSLIGQFNQYNNMTLAGIHTLLIFHVSRSAWHLNETFRVIGLISRLSSLIS